MALKQRLLEREEEVSRLRACLETAAAGRGRLVVIEADPGLGKTQLIEAAVAEAEALGARPLRGRGSDLEREFAFGVVRQLLEPPLAGLEPTELKQRFAGPAAYARPLFAIAGNGEPLAADSSFQTLQALHWLLHRLSADQPLLLAVDDAHWADAPSLRFLSYLLHRLGHLAVAIVIASRRVAPDQERPLAELVCAPDAVTLSPRPLSAGATGELIAAELGVESEELAKACQKATAGNPFFLRVLLRELAGLGATDPVATARRVAALGPRSVSRSVLLRVAELPPDCVRLMRSAAILGDGAELSEVATLAEIDETSAALAADRLNQVAVLRRSRTVQFIHPIVREAVYADIPSHERSRAHTGAARLLLEAGAPSERVAAQLLEAPTGALPEAVDVLRDAAGQARLRGAPDVACAYLERALAEPGHGREADLSLELGAAAARAGRSDALQHLAAALDRADAAARLVVAAVELGQVLAYAGLMEEAAHAVIRTLDQLEDADRALRRPLEMMLLVLAETALGPRRLARDLLERAARAVDARGEAAPRGLLAVIALERALVDGNADQAARLGRAALAGGRLLEEQTAEAPHPYFATGALVLADQFNDAEQHLEQAIGKARERGSARGFAFASSMRAWLHCRQGDLRGAEADARACLDVEAEPVWELLRALAVGAVVYAQVERGELAEARDSLERLEPESQVTDSLLFQQLRLSRARLLLAEGHPEAALAETRECDRWHKEWGASRSAWAPWRLQAAEANWRLGEREEAERLAREELRLAEAFGARTGIGMGLRLVALTADRDQSLELLDRAVATLERSPARLEYARALVDLSAARRRANQRAAARPPLERGLALAEECGASALVERARTELAAAGGRPRAVDRRGRDELTPSEQRVARMASEGMSNPQIAQALFVTPKTVETHLGNAYRKLGIRSRAELRAALEARSD